MISTLKVTPEIRILIDKIKDDQKKARRGKSQAHAS